jgi:D-arginine dehydrogenase
MSSSSVDVLVVGGGLAGLSVAWHLPSDLQVRVLERASQPGTEAASQNAGMLRRTGEDPVERALAVRSGSFYREPHSDWRDLALSRETGAVLALGRDPFGLHDAVAHLRAAGVHAERITSLESIAPVFAGSPVREGWLLPDERVADGHALVQGFVRGLRRRGRSVECGRVVTGLWTQGDQVRGVETHQGRVAAARVVLAAGAWSAELARSAGLKRPLLPLRRTMLQTSASPLSSPSHPWCWIDDVGIYVRPEAGGWLCSPCDESPEASPSEDSRGSTTPRHEGLAAEKLERYFPALSSLNFIGGWTGLRTFAPDRRPLMGADPELEGLWWAAGLGGFGLSCSPAVGEAVASWIQGLPVPWLPSDLVHPGRSFLQQWPIRPDGDHHGSVMIHAGAQ